MNLIKHIKVTKKEYHKWIAYVESCGRILHINNLNDIDETLDQFSNLHAYRMGREYFISVRLEDINGQEQ